MIFRENGWQQGLVPNRLTSGRQECIAGPFLLCSVDEDGFASLSPAEKINPPFLSWQSTDLRQRSIF